MTDEHATGAERAAAFLAVAAHLDGFAHSMAAEDLWENSPDLSEAEAFRAGDVAVMIATTSADAMRAAAAEAVR